MPLLVVQRAAPEGSKSRQPRAVTASEFLWPIESFHLSRTWRGGRDGDELRFVTETGHRLHASAVKRTVAWSRLASGRRIHDVRHTAACLWLAHGVDPTTVQAWMGRASIATTKVYLHHLGTGADQAGLDRLNSRGHTGEHVQRERTRRANEAFPLRRVPPGQRGFRVVELRGFEPLTFSLRTRRATNCATAPDAAVDHGETAQPNRTLAPGQAGPKRSGVRRPGPLTGLIAGRLTRLLVGPGGGGFQSPAVVGALVYRR
jgi:Phage integrase family